MTFPPFLGLRATRHLAAWALLLVLLVTVQALEGVLSPASLRSAGLLLGAQVLAVYAHYALQDYLLPRRRYLLYVLGTVAVLLAGGGLLYWVRTILTVTFIDAAGHPQDLVPLYAQAVANVLIMLLLASAGRYVRRVLVSHWQVQQLRAQQLETELNLLKAQVNQHFLFNTLNTLNNLYGLSLAAPEQIPEALLQLADLMRYQLDSSRQSTVTVGTEAEYLANYIGLEKLRLRQNTQVEFKADLPRPNQPLPPLLLLPLVENCFKHAIGPGSENRISIELTQTDAGLSLRTRNSIPPHFRPAPSGLGLPTLRARLAQLYPGKRHRLEVEATADCHAAHLQLVLV